MAGLNDELQTLKDNEGKIKNNKVANFSYTDTAYGTDTSFDADGVSIYAYDKAQNIPKGTADILDINQTVLEKGYRSQASSITRMLVNHFFGRVSFNLNKTVDLFHSALDKIQSYLGKANGVATLDENGRIPYSQLPESSMELKGLWNASTNTPSLINGTGTNGDFYICSVAGWFDPVTGTGSETEVEGYTQYFVNDRIIYVGSESAWTRMSAGDVKTVNGVSPVAGNIQNVIFLTKAEYAVLTTDDKKGKFFIITDADTQDVSIIKDNTVSTATTWSSSKISSFIAGLQTATDADACIPNAGQRTSYILASGSSNVPVSGAQTVITSSSGAQGLRVAQFAQVLVEDTTANNYIYQRAGVYNSGVSAWDFSAWQRVITDASVDTSVTSGSSNPVSSGAVSTALSDYVKMEDIQLEVNDSTNPVASRAIKLEDYVKMAHVQLEVNDSTNPVASSAVKNALASVSTLKTLDSIESRQYTNQVNIPLSVIPSCLFFSVLLRFSDNTDDFMYIQTPTIPYSAVKKALTFTGTSGSLYIDLPKTDDNYTTNLAIISEYQDDGTLTAYLEIVLNSAQSFYSTVEYTISYI